MKEEPQFTQFEARINSMVEDIYHKMGRPVDKPTKFPKWYSKEMKATVS